MTFHGKNRSEKHIFENIHESPWVMRIPLIILSLGSIFAGMFLAKYYIGYYEIQFWNNSIVLKNASHYYLPFIQTLISKISVAFGILLASAIYFYNKKPNIKYLKTFNPLYLISYNKWYVDEIYNFLIVKPYFYLANIFWKKGDENLIDAYGPNGITRLISLSARYLSRIQSGYLFHYAFVMLGGLVIFLTWFIYF